MSSIDYCKVIKESQECLRKAEGRQGKGFLGDRIGFLRLLKSGQCSSQQQAGSLSGHSLRNSQRLWKQYGEGRMESLAYVSLRRFLLPVEQTTNTKATTLFGKTSGSVSAGS